MGQGGQKAVTTDDAKVPHNTDNSVDTVPAGSRTRACLIPAGRRGREAGIKKMTEADIKNASNGQGFSAVPEMATSVAPIGLDDTVCVHDNRGIFREAATTGRKTDL